MNGSCTRAPMSRVLLTGATGYVGGLLLKRFESEGLRVRCLVRNPAKLRAGGDVEVCQGDAQDQSSLAAALHNVETAYYLIHSMGSSRDFETEDRRAAETFGSAAAGAGVKRIIYLGGLGQPGTELSPHLRSRHEVGEILRQSGVPVVELRSSVVIGCGSLSFEMIRALVERLPVMITPRWVSVPTQPIAINDLLEYLAAARRLPDGQSRIYEIGGADRVSYGELMGQYARIRRLRRWMIPVPVLTPRLSSLWLALITPYYARVGRSLVDSLRNPTVVCDDAARREFGIRPKGVREAIEETLAEEDRSFESGEGLEALRNQPGRHWCGTRVGNRIVEVHTRAIAAPPATTFATIQRIGGQTGWYYANWLWRLRGWVDRALGGVGMRPGRPDAESLKVGDILDFWRVAAFEFGRRIRLVAEMKLPGRAWLEFSVDETREGSLIRQRASFEPRGLAGLLYWYALYPVHDVIFEGMLRRIAEAAEAAGGKK